MDALIPSPPSNLNDRASVDILRPRDVVKHAEDHRSAEHQTAVIHRRRRRMVRRRPEAEEEDDEQIDHSDSIREQPPHARDAPRAPHQLRAGDVGQDGMRGVGCDVASEPAPEEEDGDDEVRAEEPDDGEGDDVVESGRGAEDDEREEAGDGRCDGDGEEGDGGRGVDALEVAPAGHGAVAGEGPELAGGGGGLADSRAQGEGDDDGCHEGGAGEVLDGLGEDLHEGEVGRGVERGVDVADAEEQGERHAQPQGAVEDDAECYRPGDYDCGVVDFFRHVDRSVGAEECKDVAQQSDEEGESVCRPVASVDEGLEHFRGWRVRSQNDEWE